MDVMIIFTAIIVIFGLYLVITALKMKKNGEISSAVLAKEELASCRDKAGFIDFMYWREALFGGMMILLGVFNIMDEYLFSLVRIYKLIPTFLFLVSFVWFTHGLRTARERFLV